MTITYLGHSCFRLEQDGFSLVIDPYCQVDGLADTAGTADAVFCSHEHFDHNFTQQLQLTGRQDSPFAVRTMDVFHDDQGGALRGPNRIHIFTAGGVTVAHLGDLGHQLTAEQAAAIGPLDALLIPVGGTYTVDPAGAGQVVEQLKPRVVIPMHYRSGDVGFPVLRPIEEFLDLRPAGEVRRYDQEGISSLTLTSDTPAQTAVLAITTL